MSNNFEQNAQIIAYADKFDVNEPINNKHEKQNDQKDEYDSDTSLSSTRSAKSREEEQTEDGFVVQKKNALVNMIKTSKYSPVVINEEIMNSFEELTAPPDDKRSFVWGSILMFIAAFLFSITTAIVEWNHMYGRYSFEIFVFRMFIQLFVTTIVASISVVMNNNYCYESLSAFSTTEYDEGDTETEWESDAELGELSKPRPKRPRRHSHHRRRSRFPKLSRILQGKYKCQRPCCQIRCVCTDVFAKFWKESSSKVKWCILARGVCGGTGAVCYYWAVDILPIDDVLFLFSLYPVFSSIFSMLILKERVTYQHVLSLCIAMVGILLITHPSFIFGRDDRDDRIYNIWETDWRKLIEGYGYAFIGSVCYGFVYVFIRMAYKAPTFSLIFSNGLFGLVEAVLICVLFHRFVPIPMWQDWLIAFGIAVIGYLAQNAENRSGKCMFASLAALIRVTEVFWEYVWQNLLYSQPAGMIASVGAACLALSIFLMMNDKYKNIKDIEISSALEGVIDYETDLETDLENYDLAKKNVNYEYKRKKHRPSLPAKLAEKICGGYDEHHQRYAFKPVEITDFDGI
eukprot:CAMPEP_0197033380 /NCGR_PEP_ID=MMETSP1384-20130603/11806_1 /TAXON_ID=29189 /ORGANISM="Ammonia sp." /LENGTH=572 /DNA_ID=CAMNT_0042463185 /DNA_START=38 /DNA_END=1756 /DNA_ORIENTATION=-